MEEYEDPYLEFYEGFFEEMPEFEPVRQFTQDGLEISVRFFFFGHLFLYIVMGLSELTKDKNTVVAKKAEYYLKRTLGYITELYYQEDHSYGEEIMDELAYNLYLVGMEYDTVLSYASEIIVKEVERINKFYIIPDPRQQDKSAYKKLRRAVEGIATR